MTLRLGRALTLSGIKTSIFVCTGFFDARKQMIRRLIIWSGIISNRNRNVVAAFVELLALVFNETNAALNAKDEKMSHWERSFPASQVDCPNHTWIAHVLEDLSDYCDYQELSALKQELDTLLARLVEGDLLKTDASPKLEMLH